MPVRDAVPGDLDELDVLADLMVSSDWRCDASVSRPSRAQIEAWLDGRHGTHLFVIETLGNIEAAIVHRAARVKWLILERKLGLLLRIVQLAQAVFDREGDCWGTVRDDAARVDIRGDGRFRFVGDRINYEG